MDKNLWRNEPKTEDLINYLSKLETKSSVPDKEITLAKNRLNHLQEIVNAFIQDIQCTYIHEHEIAILLQKGFTRDELVNQYGYTKNEVLAVEYKYKNKKISVSDIKINITDIENK